MSAGVSIDRAQETGDPQHQCGLAGVVLLTPVPLPGTSLMPFAIAEGVVRLRRLLKGKPAAEMATGYGGEDVGGELDDLALAIRDTLDEIYREVGEEPPEIDERAMQHVLELLGRSRGGPAVEYGRILEAPNANHPKTWIVQPDGGGKPYHTTRPPADAKSSRVTEKRKDGEPGRVTEKRKGGEPGRVTEKGGAKPQIPNDIREMKDQQRHLLIQQLLPPPHEWPKMGGKRRDKSANDYMIGKLSQLENHELLAIIDHYVQASTGGNGGMGAVYKNWAAKANEVLLSRLMARLSEVNLLNGQAAGFDATCRHGAINFKLASSDDRDKFDNKSNPAIILAELKRHGLTRFARVVLMNQPGNPGGLNGLWVYPDFGKERYGDGKKSMVRVCSEEEFRRLLTIAPHELGAKLDKVLANIDWLAVEDKMIRSKQTKQEEYVDVAKDVLEDAPAEVLSRFLNNAVDLAKDAPAEVQDALIERLLKMQAEREKAKKKGN